MLVAWSPIRSTFFEQNSRWAQNEMLRGSSIMWVRRSRNTESSSASISASRSHTVPRALGVALGVGVEHVLHQLGGDVVHVAQADDRARHPRFDADLQRPFGDVLGQVADPLEVAGDPDRADDLAQIDRHRLAPGDGENRLLLDLALQRVEARVGGDDLVGQRHVGLAQRVHRVDHHLLGDAAHFGDPPLEGVEILVVRSDGVIDHGADSFNRTGR